MRKIYLSISLIFCVLSLFSQTPSTVFEIENILVDACGGTVEGENEMVRFHVGPYSLNTANLSVSGAGSSGIITVNKWPNTGNSWLGLTQNTTTASKTAQINATITGCGLFKEPVAGILPAGCKVLLITSTAFNPTVTDFSGLNDTLYIIFQSPGNTAGHFVNYTAGNSTRTLVLRFSGPHPYADTVVYHPELLITQTGIAGAQDGASVSYTWSGIPTYYNNGCTAPVNPLISISVTPALPVCPGTPVTFSSTVINGSPNPVYQWLVNNMPVGTNNSSFTTSSLSNNDVVSCRLISNTTCNNHDTAFSNVITVSLNPRPVVTITPSSPPAICAGSSVLLTAAGAGTYAWSPATGLSSVSVPNVTATPSVTTTYTVTGTLSGCTNTARVVVTVNPLPIVSITPPVPLPICPSTSVVLTASGAGTYAWSPSTGLNIASGPTVTATPVSTITYTVTGTTSGCSATARVVVNVNPVLSISITPSSPNPICAGSNIVLAASGGTTYLWSPASGLNTTSGSTVTASPAVNTTYTVTGTSSGCSGTASVIITVNPVPVIVINPSSPAPVCAGSSVSLTANGGSTYTWSPSMGLNSVNGSNVSASPVTTTTYTVTGTSSGCSATSQVVVRINPMPVVTVTPAAPAPVCPGTSVTLTASGADIYTWSPGSGLNTTSGANVTASPSVSTTYTVTGTSSGCSSSATVVVNINSNLIVNIAPSLPSPICSGASVALNASGASEYLWSPATGLNTTSGTTVIANPAVSTTYTVTGTSSGCSGTASVIITVNPVPVVSINPISPNPVCSGRSVPLTASGASAYTWSPAAGLNTTTGANVTASPSVNITYTVSGTTSGCSSAASVVVSINPLPEVIVTSVPNPAVICAGGSVSITGAGAVIYTWSPSSGLSSVTGPTVISSPAVSTHYMVTGTDINGCPDTASITVIINTPVVNVDPAQTEICEGSQTILTASGGESYLWSPSAGLNSTSGTSVSANPVSSVTYTVTGTNSGGCANTASAVVIVHPLPVISIEPLNPVPVCSGDTVELHASGALTYSWSPAVNLINPDGSVVFAHPDFNTLFAVTGTDVNGCPGNTSVLLRVDSFFTVSVSPGNASICAGESVILAATGATSYVWAPANGLSSATSSTVVASPDYSTIYCLTGTIHNCSKKVYIPVIVNPLPEAGLNIHPEMVSLNNPQQYFQDISTGNPVSWQWDLGNGDVSGFQNFYYSYSDTGNYNVRLIVYTEYGCSDTAYGSTTVLPDFTVYIPNAFTPNSDRVNNIFYIYGNGIFDVQIRIFDRWGVQVFESKDMHQGWDGKFKGNIMPQDVYPYIVSYRDVFDKQYFRYGHVTLVR